MDNNENNINNENLVKDNAETKETNSVEESTEYVSQFSELTNADGEPIVTPSSVTPVEVPKKKFFLFKYINPSIFIAICVFLVALIAFGVYWIFGSKTITGTWMIEQESSSSSNSTSDEVEKVKVYYTFEKADSNGKGSGYVQAQGSKQAFEYTLSTSGDKKKVTVSNAEFTYEITGTKLFGTAKLKLTQEAYTDQSTGTKVKATTRELSQSSEPDYGEMAMKDYKVDDKLVGKWDTEYKLPEGYGMYQFNVDIEFMDNGIMAFHEKDNDYNTGYDVTYYFAYTAKDGKITLQSVADEKGETKFSIEYTLKDGILKLVDKNNKTMFSESVIGSAQFYKDGEKKPEGITTATSATETATETATQATTQATTKAQTSTKKAK